MACKIYEYILQVSLFYFFRFLETFCHQFIYKLVRRSQCNDLSAINYGNPVTQYFGFIHIVGSDDYGSPFLANIPDEVPQISSCLWIEPCSRLIKENDLWLI